MAANTCTWTTETVSDLIDLFEERPCLYNTKHKDYFNRDLRSKALEISREIGFPGEYVKQEHDNNNYCECVRACVRACVHACVRM